MSMEIVSMLNELNEMLENFLANAGMWAPFFSTILVFFEGIFAFLPLVVFVTVNVESFNLLIGSPWGTIVGILISWVFSVAGGYCTFLLCRKGLQRFFLKHFKKKGLIRKFVDFVSTAKFSFIVLFMACAFTPSFIMNVGAGLSTMSKRRYLYIILIGKFFCVCFLAYVGTGLIECLTNPYKFIEMIIMLFVAYFFSKYVSKVFDLDKE